MVNFIIFLVSISIILYFIYRKKTPLLQPDFQTERQILQQHVLFYQRLPEEEKARFEKQLQKFLQKVRITGVKAVVEDMDRIFVAAAAIIPIFAFKARFEKQLQKFLQKVRITGVKAVVEDMDRIFVAAAAIIPIFAFKGWEYKNIHEVLLYPGSFTGEYRIAGQGRDTLGMVGNGPMQNVMILSQLDLRDGFFNHTGRSNTGIHEFVHLVDKTDGDTDGLPETLLSHKYVLPWLQRIHQEIQLIKSGESDINPYGATNEAEFLAVAAEYFFTQPQLMKQKHPVLFDMLQQIFILSADELSN